MCLQILYVCVSWNKFKNVICTLPNHNALCFAHQQCLCGDGRHTHIHTAAVHVFPADSVSISLSLHYDSIPHSVIHAIRQTENSTIVNSASFWCLRGFNACPDGFPEISIFKVARQFPQYQFITVTENNTTTLDNNRILKKASSLLVQTQQLKQCFSKAVSRHSYNES